MIFPQLHLENEMIEEYTSEMDINFLDADKKEGKEGPSFRGFLLLLSLTIAVLISFGAFLFISRGNNGGTTILATAFKRLLRSGDIVLKGMREDRINVLLLGIGGAGHDGGYLTDTILLASVKPSTKEAALLSIPRDLAVPVQENEWRKINSVSAFAESVAPGSGGEAARAALERILQIPIPYYLRVDFDGFVRLVDAIGGITVDVERRLEDRRYPIPGKEYAYPVADRYEHLIIEPGMQMMDGATALKYARSRRGEAPEGSDFARVKRQQKILLAVRERVFSWPVLLNPGRLSPIVSSLSQNITTNILISEALRFTDVAKEIDRKRIRQFTLSDAPEGLLASRMVNGAYILEPRDGTFAEVRALANDLFTRQLPSPTHEEKIRIALLNGTSVAGLAKAIGAILTTQGFTITSVGNAPRKPLPQTRIYDLTNGDAFLAYDRLRLLLNAIPATDKEDPFAPFVAAVPDADFVIILGEDTKLP